MDVSFIWSLRLGSLIAAVQMILCHKESILAHILGLLPEVEAFTHTLPLSGRAATSAVTALLTLPLPQRHLLTNCRASLVFYSCVLHCSLSS